MKSIIINGARQNNLRNIDLEIPRDRITAVTGVSGSGKSSLAFDTIYAEGQRRYIESLSTYARQFLEKLEKPDLDSITGISPTIAIRRKNTVKSGRSTVGTATEIYDCLRLLYARIGRTFCPQCGLPVSSYSPGEAADEVLEGSSGRKVYILLPLSRDSQEDWERRKKYLLSRGYLRLLVSGKPVRIDECDETPREKTSILIDRVEAVQENRNRIVEGIELAYREHGESVDVKETKGGRKYIFTDRPTCNSCGRVFKEPSPLLFSFNSPYGACPDCKGYGDRMEFSEDKIVPEPQKSIRDKAIDPWARERFDYFYFQLLDFCRNKGIPADIPFSQLPDEDRARILEGEGDFIGVIPFLEKMRKKAYKKGHRFFTRRYMSFTTCRTCRGRRLRAEAGNVKVGGYAITELNSMTPQEVLDIINSLKLERREKKISRDLMNELTSRLEFMIDVGLDYLTLDRVSRTLSGGEAQRINLANSMGANLVDTVYILDEPSVGLHAADNDRLIKVMKNLRDSGNTVIVVEHDPNIILSSDYLIDLGPGAGSNGGEVVFSGETGGAESARVENSRTIEYLFNKTERVSLNRAQRKPAGSITLKGVRTHNLRSIDLEIPLGGLVAVTGVSGSGKSSLVVDTLHELLSKGSGRGLKIVDYRIEGRIDSCSLVDQKPIGNTPRSNPVTFIKGFSYIRQLFAEQKKSLERGYRPGRFSFNKPEGRCPRCRGMGYRRVEMHFMADVFVPCEQCGGRRYNSETLDVTYRGKDISEVLELTVSEAILFFDGTPQLGEKLWLLSEVGLGYLRLGQPSNTLSGGEAQRIKIARELSESAGRRNLYIMDEPTTGLHMSDIDNLLRIFQKLVKAGHTLIVIEHNLDLIGNSDWIIDLGPGGGGKGGKIVASGTPVEIADRADSVTGRYLKDYVKGGSR
ncbi:MAG: excinuclease ABC subunit UvrA [Candidatus Krumholzibacteriales bacterium]